MKKKIRIKSTSLVQFRKSLIQFLDHIYTFIENLICACWKTQAEHPVHSPTTPHFCFIALRNFGLVSWSFKTVRLSLIVSHIFQLAFSLALLVRRVVGCRFYTRYLISSVHKWFGPIHSSYWAEGKSPLTGLTANQKFDQKESTISEFYSFNSFFIPEYT